MCFKHPTATNKLPCFPNEAENKKNVALSVTVSIRRDRLTWPKETTLPLVPGLALLLLGLHNPIYRGLLPQMTIFALFTKDNNPLPFHRSTFLHHSIHLPFVLE